MNKCRNNFGFSNDKINKMNWKITNKESPGETEFDVIGYSEHWVDQDFNPKGIRVCTYSDIGWTCAKWNDYHSCYVSLSQWAEGVTNEECVPQKWVSIVEPESKGEDIKPWMIEKTETYWYYSGRNYKKYVEVTFWYTSEGDRKETVRQHDCSIGDDYARPEWAKLIINFNESLSYT